MGCTCEKVWRRKHSKVGHESESSSSTPPSMSDAQKAVIRNNWQTLKCHVANIGVITYVSMFESRPELLELFSKFKEQNINELRRAGLLRQHALRVMTTIDKVITRLDEPSSLIVMLREVGAHHKLYKVPPDYIQIILPHFLSAIKPHIEEHWCDDLETAWKTMFAIIIFHMSEGASGEYVCAECGKAFATFAEMKQHQLRKTCTRLTCDTCGKKGKTYAHTMTLGHA